MASAEVRTEDGKPCLFVAVDRTPKFAVARLHGEVTRPTACQVLQELLEMVPYRIHTLLDRQRHPFRPTQPRNRNTILSRMSRFDMICQANEIEHRLTKRNHPWSEEGQPAVQWTAGPMNGQVERMNRTIKDATTKRYHYEDHEQLEAHLGLFLDAYSQARRLKTLKGLPPAQVIWREWQPRPEPLHDEPCHLITSRAT